MIPRAAYLRGLAEPDTAFGYHFDLEKLPGDFDPVARARALGAPVQ